MTTRTVSVLLQAEIGSYVAGMTKAAIATKGVGESAQTTGAKVNKGFDLAGRGALLLGGAVAGALVGIISKSMDFEKSMSGVQAATQATAGTMADLRDAAMKAGADTQYSATEAADAITEMAKAGVSAADIMGGGLTGALSLAAAGQIDVAQAAGIASTAMTQFGLVGKDLPHVADLLAAGAGKAMGSVDDLGMALNQAGLVASASGLSIEETTGTLAAFASAGLLGSDAGTSMKTMLQKLQAPSKEAAGVMSDLGINMYDANGNMLSMAGMAGQLQTKMSGLTQEQRNAALATIFGSDAVRAANVLYTQGAKGIADWTTKVNDQGYAAKQAAQLTDNLAGDLERLGGSFDTLLITLGSGAQGPLRELVQMLGALVDGVAWAVDAFAGLPGPLQATVVGLAALAALRGPLSGLFTTMQVKAVLGTSAILENVLSVDKLRASLGKLAVAGAGLAVAWSFTKAIDEVVSFTHAGDDAQAMIDSLKDSLRGIEGPARLEANRAAISQLRDELERYQEILDKFNDQNWFDKAIWNNPFDNNDEVKKARESVGLLQAEIDRLKGKTEQGAAGAEGWAGAVQGSGEAAANAAPAVDSLAVMLQGAADAADAAKKETDLFKLSLDILTGAHVSVAEAEASMYAALDSAKGAMEGLTGAVLDNAGELNAQSESGRKAQEILHGIRDAGGQYIATLIQQGATTEQVLKADADLRAGFIQSAGQMGISSEAANHLADEILGIPAERETKIRADIGQAATAIASIQTSLGELRDKTVTITTKTTYDNGTYSVHRNTAAQASGGILHAYASGGIEPMGNRIATTVPANTLRLIGDNMRVPESFIPQDGSARSWAIWRQTGEAMAKLGGSREVSGAGQTVVVQQAAPSQSSAGPLVQVGTMIVPKQETPYETAEALSFMARTRG